MREFCKILKVSRDAGGCSESGGAGEVLESRMVWGGEGGRGGG